MGYRIEPVFIIFPLVCLLLHVTKIKANRWLHFLLIVLFVLIYSFSLNGSDFEGYKWHYELVERGGTAAENDQEIGYYYLMRLAVWCGLDYVVFRTVLLSILAFVLFCTISKSTDDFPLALFFISSMFVIYTISAYRQFIVMAFSIMWLNQYARGRKTIAIIGTGILLLFHITAILPLGCMLFEWYGTKRRIEKTTGFFKSNYIYIIAVALAIRVIMTVMLKNDLVNAIIKKVIRNHASTTPTLFGLGFFARLVFLFFITYLYLESQTDNSLIKLYFWYFFVSVIIYISVPLEFFMGRLMNNAYILGAVLIPMLRNEIIQGKNTKGLRIRGETVRQISIMLELLALVILLNQLTKQNGYTPYLNVVVQVLTQ